MIEKEYLASRVAQANPAQLVEIVFEGLLDTINEAIVSIKDNDENKLKKSVYKAREIIAELLSTVQGQSEIAQNLKIMYIFLNKLITEGEIERDIEKLEKAVKIVTPLYEAWGELGAKEVAVATENKGPSIVAGVTYGKGQLNDYVVNNEARWEKG